MPIFRSLDLERMLIYQKLWKSAIYHSIKLPFDAEVAKKFLNVIYCIEPTLRMARMRKLTEQKVILSMISHQWRWLCCQGVVAFTKFQSNLARFMLISNQLKRREKSIGWVSNWTHSGSSIWKYISLALLITVRAVARSENSEGGRGARSIGWG